MCFAVCLAWPCYSLRVGDDVCVAEVEEWADGLEEIRELIGPRFARSEPKENAVDYLCGLLSGAERKNF